MHYINNLVNGTYGLTSHPKDEAIIWLSVLLKDTRALTGQAGIRTHILTTPELEFYILDCSATHKHNAFSIILQVSLPTGEKRACMTNDFNSSTIIPQSQDNSSRHERSAKRFNFDQFTRDDPSSEIQENQVRNFIHGDWKGSTEDGVLKSQSANRYSIKTTTVLHKVSKSLGTSAVKTLSSGVANFLFYVGLTRYESFEATPVPEGDKHSDHSGKMVKRGIGQALLATTEQPSTVSSLRLPSDLKMTASPKLTQLGTSPKTTNKVRSVTENISNAGTDLEQTTASSGVVIHESLEFSNDSETTGSTSQTEVTMVGNNTKSLFEKGPGIAQIMAFISLTLYVGAYSYGFGPGE